MNLKNFNKSTQELRAALILKGDQETVSYIADITIDHQQKEIILSLTNQETSITLQKLRNTVKNIPSDFKFFLMNPESNLKTYTFGYYLRGQFFVFK